MEKVLFASLYVHDVMTVTRIHESGAEMLNFSSSFVEKNGREAADQTADELGDLLKENCETYILTYQQRLLPVKIEVRERYDSLSETMIYDAFLLPSHSASFK